MSNDVVGYAVLSRPELVSGWWEDASACARTLGIGLRRVGPGDLYGIRPDAADESRGLCFRVTDGPEKENASYLVDCVDYSPDAVIGLPLKGEVRLGLLLGWGKAMLRRVGVESFSLVLTDSNILEGVRRADPVAVWDLLVRDCEDYCPPNMAYVAGL